MEGGCELKKDKICLWPFHFENLEGTDKTISSLKISKEAFLLSITDWLIFFGLKYSKSVPLGTEKISFLSILKFSIK